MYGGNKTAADCGCFVNDYETCGGIEAPVIGAHTGSNVPHENCARFMSVY